jgi:twitching motility protein PilJ
MTTQASPPDEAKSAPATVAAGADDPENFDLLPGRSLPAVGRMSAARQMKILLTLMIAFALLFMLTLALIEWEGHLQALRSLVEQLALPLHLILVALCLPFMLSTLGLVKVALDENRSRTAETRARELVADRAEAKAKDASARTRQAVLRLTSELQQVADGNLTARATVSEVITGTIAGAINHALDEIRFLVGRINHAAAQVTEASGAAWEITTALLQASGKQSEEVRSTGQKILAMARSINDASHRAAESARVARASLSAAQNGATAVQSQIAGMHGIRDQIQNTAKRVKRLGESSQEIGEIVELISDIAEQTHVLALNAAIQAAAAGESGRGFAIVAEEVQLLADRSADAAHQIGTLIRMIQSDTHDTVVAMERSTVDVVEGTKLSDAAGTSLAEIGRVTREVTGLIENVAHVTEVQARTAADVADSIERILKVTDEASEDARKAARSIAQLTELAQELKSSVARFRVE